MSSSDMHKRGLYPELEEHLRKLAERLGKLKVPLHAYIAGGVAVNYYTGVRMSDDVDIAWSHRVPIPPDLRIFEVPSADDPSDVTLVTMDGEFGDYLGTFHPDWKGDALEIGQVGDIVLHVISPLDLAVSKVGRFQDRDREDIETLARFNLIDVEDFEARTREAIEYFVGDTTYVQYNLRDAIERIKALDTGHGQ